MAGWLVACLLLAALVARRRSEGARMELIARADHELRGPLTAARLALHGIDDREHARAVLDLELCRATLAVQDLTLARRGERTPRRDEVLDAVHVASCSIAAAAAFGARVSLDVPPRPVPVRADRLRLAQAVANLVANAAEHGGGGDVEVRVRAADGLVRIEVRDDGPGLPAPVPVLAAGPRRGNRGRGLAIALAATQDCGGRLLAAPSVRGARLAIELPAVGELALRTPGLEQERS